MKQLRLRDVLTLLTAYREDFGFLDVFAHHIAEIATNEPVFAKLDPDHFRTWVDGKLLDLQMVRAKNVARFSLVPEGPIVVAAALLGAVAGAALAGSGTRKDAPEEAVFGLLVGGLLGVAAASSAPVARPPRQVLTLRYDQGSGEWKIYHGPYLSWAKEALRGD